MRLMRCHALQVGIHDYPQLVGLPWRELHFYFPCELVYTSVYNRQSQAVQTE